MFNNLSKKIQDRNQEWHMDDQNTLTFSLSKKLHKKKFAAVSLFDHPVVSYILMFSCLFVDLALFYQLMCVIGVDAWYITLLGILGFAIGYDVGPVILGIQLKKMRQGLDVDPSNRKFIIGLVIAFVIATGVNLGMRIAYRTTALPMTADIKSIYTQASWAYAAFCFIVPIVTSIVSFCVSYFNSNPLKTELEHAEEREIMLKDRIRQIEGALAEYIPDTEFREQLTKSDDALCANKLYMVDEKALGYCYYVRQKLKEHLGDPADISELSKDIRQEVMTKLYSDGMKTEVAQEINGGAVFAAIN